jgi:hypothetical protein
METQMEFSEIEPSFNAIRIGFISQVLTLSEDYPSLTLTSVENNRTLLAIHNDGTVIAPDLESASEAGRVFVQSIREQLNFNL